MKKKSTAPAIDLGADRNNGHAEQPAQAIELPRMRVNNVRFKLNGVSRLEILRFSEKARNMMLDKQMGKASAGKTAKDPLSLFKDSYYRIGDHLCIPAVCFKAAGVNCANDIDQKQTEMRRAFFTNGIIDDKINLDWVKIECPPLDKADYTEWDEKYEKDLKWEHSQGCSMVHRMVRNATGVADIRFRASFPKWSVNISVDYNESIISLENLLMLMNVAGFGNGVGEWRPASKESKTGTFGRWEVETSK